MASAEDLETTIDADVLIARNPSTGAELGRVSRTPPGKAADVVRRSRIAQATWGALSWRERSAALARWWRVLARDADAFARAITQEIGKPSGEALAEMVMALDSIRWTLRRGGRALAGEWIGPGWQRWLLMPGGRLDYRPFGVIGIVGTWNYPVFLNAPTIAQALAAGNSVVWKPSELAPLIGQKLQQSFEEAGLPEGLVMAIQGGPEVGKDLVESDLDKGVFTGGIANGRRVLETLAARGIPALAELSGFDPAIVLPDAPRGSSARALTWAAFVGSGQACVAVKRIYVVGDPAPWVEAIAEGARSLRIGDPGTGPVDIGPMISSAARERFDGTIRAAVAQGATVHAGAASVGGPGWFYAPTVLSASSARPERALEGVFGPVVLIRGVSDPDEAVAASNASPFGLGASIWSRDLSRARALARRLEAGMVTINEAVSPAGHASLPFGGVKASGFGRTHGALGIREFTQPRALLVRKPWAFRPQLFPYTARMIRLLSTYLRLFHRGR